MRLPAIRGKYRAQADLSKSTWFQVGGAAEMLFKPVDRDDLAAFLRECPADIPVTVLGVGSNLLVRDGGIDGVVIRLGRGFTNIAVEGELIHAGAGAMDVHVAETAMRHGVGGLEFLSGIPGGVGGALAMNGGAYGSEVSEVLVEAEAVMPDGSLRVFSVQELQYGYRRCGLLETPSPASGGGSGWGHHAGDDPNNAPLPSSPLRGEGVTPIFTRATFRGRVEDSDAIARRMREIAESREDSQPIRSRTGGSTFKNPPGGKAWKLIEDAGCRGLVLGGAQVSEKHCNFLINTGTATAADLENLGEEVRRRVREHSGVTLEWEIKRLGRPI